MPVPTCPPLTPPRNLPPVWLATLAAAAIGVTLGYPVASILFESELGRRVPEVFVAVTTGMLCFLVVGRASTRRTRIGCGVSALVWSLLAGGLNAGLAAQCQSLSRSHVTLGPLVVGTIFGFFFAAPLSAGFAVINAALAMAAHEAWRARSHQALDLMLGYAGASVAAFGALRLAFAPNGWTLLPIAAGSLAASIGFSRARTRRAWLRAVDLGEVPGFSIEILDGEADPRLPCLLGKAGGAKAVLVHSREDEQHYRDGVRERHVAVLDPWGP
jgi:hypothetical protein